MRRGWAGGWRTRGVLSTCVAAARWRGCGSHLLRVAGNFEQNSGRWRRLLVLRCRLRSGCADWVVLGYGINVTRVTRGENIFNNKIYIGDLASIEDVRRLTARYRGEYQEVPATSLTLMVFIANRTEPELGIFYIDRTRTESELRFL